MHTTAMDDKAKGEPLPEDHQSVNHHVVHAFNCNSDCFGCSRIHNGCPDDDWSSIEMSRQNCIE